MHKIAYLIQNPISEADVEHVRPVPELYITSSKIIDQMKKWNWIDFELVGDGYQMKFDGKPIIVNNFIS